MPACDSCSGPTSWEEGTAYTAAEFRRMVAQGLGPAETTLNLYAAMGMPIHEAISQWKNGLVAQSTTGWLLCPDCAAKAARYLPKRAGTGPAGHVLTESISVDKLFPTAPSGATSTETRYAAGEVISRSQSPTSTAMRVVLVVFASLWLLSMLLPIGRTSWVLGIRLASAAGVAVLAYRYALQLNRSGIKWGIFSFLLPAPTLFVLPFLRAR